MVPALTNIDAAFATAERVRRVMAAKRTWEMAATQVLDFLRSGHRRLG